MIHAKTIQPAVGYFVERGEVLARQNGYLLIE